MKKVNPKPSLLKQKIYISKLEKFASSSFLEIMDKFGLETAKRFILDGDVILDEINGKGIDSKMSSFILDCFYKRNNDLGVYLKNKGTKFVELGIMNRFIFEFDNVCSVLAENNFDDKNFCVNLMLPYTAKEYMEIYNEKSVFVGEIGKDVMVNPKGKRIVTLFGKLKGNENE